jgi:para-nitrobenzyl esterase
MTETMEVKELLRSMYGGENKRIADEDFDKSLAVRCKNGTFVGRRTENIIIYRDIPFVGK